MPIVEDITVYRGEQITLHMSMTPPEDITGWVISMTVAKNRNMTGKVFQVTGIATIAPMGKYDLILTGNLNIEPATYYYDIFRTNPLQERCLNWGELIVTADARYPQ